MISALYALKCKKARNTHDLRPVGGPLAFGR